jgi:hypothetical protein
MDGIEFIFTAILVSIYILIGSFWAWVLGIVPITLPWLAVTILWPIIGVLLFFVGMVVVGCVSMLLASIFGTRTTSN